jgi:hypothetical protein
VKSNTQHLFERIGHPSQWHAEAERCAVDEVYAAYVAFDPAWAEEIPTDSTADRRLHYPALSTKD